MNIEHTWNIVEITTSHMHIMVSSVKLELTSTLDRFTIKDTIDIDLIKNFSRDMILFEDVTEEMCLEWTDKLGKFQKEKLIKQHQDKLNFMYEDWYMRCNRKYSEEKLPWNKNN